MGGDDGVWKGIREAAEKQGEGERDSKAKRRSGWLSPWWFHSSKRSFEKLAAIIASVFPAS